jgi:hypothetical protein
LKKETLSILLSLFVLASCQKEIIETPVVLEKQPACIAQKENPAGRTYATNSLTAYDCKAKHCGFLPLSTKSYWVYQDSLFNDGIFVSTKIDTLKFNETYLSKSDSLTWWKANKYVGLPQLLYANDGTLYGAAAKLFSPTSTVVSKSYGDFTGDSTTYFTSFDDIRATGRSIKLPGVTNVPAGKFSNTILFEKSADYYGKDQILFQPGIGVLKYIQLRTPISEDENKLQKISTLIAFYQE